jgi:hypothetical protein
MSRDNPYVPRVQSVKLGKFLLAFSFFLPYMVLYADSDWLDWMIYAPIWVIQGHQGNLIGAFTPLAVIAFQVWFPYTFMGYQAYRYASGRLSGDRSYLLSIVALTILAILLTLNLSMIPSGFDGDEYTYNLYIPVPIFSILALSSYQLLRPTRVEAPWTEESEQEDATPDQESVWTD